MCPHCSIYAEDDPVVPADQYLDIDWSAFPALQPLITRTGGHCGFRAQGLGDFWHNHCIDLFVLRLVAQRRLSENSMEATD